MQQTEIENIAEQVGRKFGFTQVQVEVVANTELKVNWKRTTDWIAFSICDYFDDASEEIVTELFESLYARIRGQSDRYTEKFTDYLFSNEFIESNLAKYIERKKYIEDGILTERIHSLVDVLMHDITGAKVYKGRQYAYSVLFKALEVPNTEEVNVSELARIIAEYGTLRSERTLGNIRTDRTDLTEYIDTLSQAF